MENSGERLEAHFENRIYYFYLLSIKEKDVRITMYNTRYIFQLKEGEWVNSNLNFMNMSPKLMNVVLKVLKVIE